jgi:hypothetical protein
VGSFDSAFGSTQDDRKKMLRMTRNKAHNPHLSALLTPSPFIKVEGKGLDVFPCTPITSKNSEQLVRSFEIFFKFSLEIISLRTEVRDEPF